MKKTRTIWMLILACIVSVGIMSCADKEDGESWDDWEFRNTINGMPWHVDKIKDANGNWKSWSDASLFWFEVKFSASNHNFNSEKFYYNDGVADESTREKYDSSNNTAYTISGKTIEATVDGTKYFRIVLNEKVTSLMKCSLYFYKENKTFEVIMSR